MLLQWNFIVTLMKTLILTYFGNFWGQKTPQNMAPWSTFTLNYLWYTHKQSFMVTQYKPFSKNDQIHEFWTILAFSGSKKLKYVAPGGHGSLHTWKYLGNTCNVSFIVTQEKLFRKMAKHLNFYLFWLFCVKKRRRKIWPRGIICVCFKVPPICL